MPLKAAQKSQLLSAYAMIAQYRREMEDLVQRGVPPAGSSARLRPLPAAEADALLQPLAALQSRLRETILSLTGDDPEANQPTQSSRATRIWSANVLDRVRDTLASIEPGRLSPRYGALSKPDADALREVSGALQTLLEEACGALRGR